MYYESTRNNKLKKKFSEVLLEGLADDGGLYVPKKWPKVSKKELSKFKNMNYQQIAFHISKKFIENEINDKDLKRIIINSDVVNDKTPPILLYSSERGKQKLAINKT